MNAVQICNLALGRLGGRAAIQSLDDADEEARACAVVYPATVASALTAYAWPFAERRATLARLPASPSEAWGYAYALPVDCIKPVRLDDGLPWRPRGPAYAIEGSALLCDLDAAELVYVADVAPELWPPSFVQYVSWRLAGELALALDARADLAKFALDRASAEELRAISEVRAAERPRRDPDAEWIAARGGGPLDDFLENGTAR